jgi:ATP-dependent exoDNAse (exonuclease V) beta subunit
MDYESRDKVLNDLRRLVVEGCRESPSKINTLNAIENLLENGDSKEDIEWIIDFGNIMSKAPAIRGTADSVDEANQKVTDIWRSQKVYDLQEEYIKTIFRLAKEWNEQYAEYKRNKHIMDYCDMVHYMHKLLQDKEVAAEIGRTYTHLFVDEFQDCSPIQVKIFMALAEVVKKSYWVGDN